MSSEIFELPATTRDSLGRNSRMMFSSKPLPHRPIDVTVTQTKLAAEESLPGPFDHGLLPWLQVIVAFTVWVNSWGLYNSFGEFQNFYQEILMPDHSPSNIAWIGSLQAFLLLFLGPISGVLYDAGYFRLLMIVGNACVVIGLVLTSICVAYWQLMLAQGLLIGVGFGLLFVPCTAFIPQWFRRYRAIASGLAASGSGFGGVIYSIIFRELQPRVGFAWAVRAMGLVALILAILMVALIRNKVPKSPRKAPQWHAFKEGPYALCAIAGLFAFAGVYIPYFFVGPYAIKVASSSVESASWLIVIINAGSIAGRIIFGAIASKIGLFNVALVTLSGSTLLALIWFGVKTANGLIAFAIFYGIFAGAYLGFAALSIIPLTEDPRTLGSRIGQLCMFCGIAVLIGTPVGGAVLQNTQGFTGLQVFAGVTMALGTIATLVSKLIKTNGKVWVVL